MAHNYYPAANLYFSQLSDNPFSAGNKRMRVLAEGGVQGEGINKSNLTALTILTSEAQEKQLVQDVATEERTTIGVNAAGAGFNGTLALVNIALMLARKRLGLFDSVLTAAIGGLAIHQGKTAVDGVLNSDVPELEAQIKRRRAMLDSWQTPKQ